MAEIVLPSGIHDTSLKFKVIFHSLYIQRSCHIYSRCYICPINGNIWLAVLPFVFHDDTKISSSYSSQYVQLYATDRGYDCSNRDGYRKFRLGERDCYRTCIPRSIFCDSKLIESWSWKSRKASFQILKISIEQTSCSYKRSQVAFQYLLFFF